MASILSVGCSRCGGEAHYTSDDGVTRCMNSDCRYVECDTVSPDDRRGSINVDDMIDYYARTKGWR